jgi:2,4-dienoyl-CoA reductase (NADPH2)
MNDYPTLFSPFTIKNISLRNRVTMAPMFVGYGGADGRVTDLVLDHYRKIGRSGASLIVVENVCIHPTGAGSPYILRIDDDEYVGGLKRIAEVIHREGAYAFLQINHAGRYAYMNQRIAPSAVAFGKVTPTEMTAGDISHMIHAYADAAVRVREAGFDGVELHGGTGYLLAQFLSPRTNKRNDAYGGDAGKRIRFPLDVLAAVRARVGEDYPVGYRLLADELLPDGFTLEDGRAFAAVFARQGIDYLSVMVGTYESFYKPPYVDIEKTEGYMIPFAGAIKATVPHLPVIGAGRIQAPGFAETILREGAVDLIGLARVLFADPLWPRKARGEAPGPIVPCEPSCSLCMDLVLKGKRPVCSQWPAGERQAVAGKTKGV